MKRIRFLVAWTSLAAIFVTGLTWAAWPRPVTVQTLSANCVLRGLTQHGDTAQTLVEVSAPNRRFDLIRDGQVYPGFVLGRHERLHDIDADGRAYVQQGFPRVPNEMGAIESPTGGAPTNYSLRRWDYVGGTIHVVVPLPAAGFRGSNLSADLSTFVVALDRGERGTLIRVFDLPAGSVRSEWLLPNRSGAFEERSKRSACTSWTLSHDGRRLYLAEGWNQLRRTTPAGIEVHETSTGTRIELLEVGRFLPASATPRDQFGAVNLSLTPRDDALVFKLSARAELLPLYSWEISGKADARMLLDLTTKELRTEPTPSAGEFLAVRDQGPIRLLAPKAAGELRLADGSGEAVAVIPSIRIDPTKIQSDYAPFAFHRTKPMLRIAQTIDSSSDTWPVFGWLSRQLNLPPMFTRRHVISVFDWEANRLGRVFSATDDNNILPLVASEFHGRQLIVAHKSMNDPLLTLELWDLPVRREPWVWSVPTGVLSSLLLCSGFVRLRRRRRLRRLTA